MAHPFAHHPILALLALVLSVPAGGAVAYVVWCGVVMASTLSGLRVD